MTVAALEEREIPDWGLHDARLDALSVDYVARRLVIDVRVQFGERQDHEQRARLVVDELLFFVVEPPELGAGTTMAAGGRIDPCHGLLPGAVPRLPKVPSGAYGESFFVADWNAFFHFGARADVRLEWIDPVPVAKPAGALYPGDEIDVTDGDER